MALLGNFETESNPATTAVHARKHGARPDLSPGALIAHDELIRKRGAGGMGLVFLGRGVCLGRLVADDWADVSMLDVPMPGARNELPRHSEWAAIIDHCLMKRLDARAKCRGRVVAASVGASEEH